MVILRGRSGTLDVWCCMFFAIAFEFQGADECKLHGGRFAATQNALKAL